jgi:hypothetical protein
MRTDKVVHFVWFETSLNSDQFIDKWEHYTSSLNGDADVTLQASKRNNMFKYVAQHRCDSAGFQFLFTKAAKSTRSKETEVKTKQIGGYSIVQQERTNETKTGENKVFAFIVRPDADLNFYQQLKVPGKLNIYGAYYENCAYAYILEFFLKHEYVSELVERLQQHSTVEVGIYKECALHSV